MSSGQLGGRDPFIQREDHQNNITPVHSNLAGQKSWQDIFRATNEKNMQPRILYPARPFRIDGEIKSFQDWQGLKVYMTTKLALQEILRGEGSIKEQRTTQ